MFGNHQDRAHASVLFIGRHEAHQAHQAHQAHRDWLGHWISPGGVVTHALALALVRSLALLLALGACPGGLALAAAPELAQPGHSAAQRPHRALARPSKHTPRPLLKGPRFQKNAAFLGLVERLSTKTSLPPSWVLEQLSGAHHLEQVRQLIMPAASGTRKNWLAYRARVLTEERIRWGQAFSQAHARELKKAEDLYGVPGSVVVAILGVETLYGRHMGQYPALDALTTLALDFPPNHPRHDERAQFFEAELAALLLLMKDEPHSYSHSHSHSPILSSYAGALGMAQFMPSNWRRFGVDFDGDGRVDLMHSASDAIGSVAHYLEAFGWRRGLPTHYAFEPSEWRMKEPAAAQWESLLAPDILPTFSPERLQALGLTLSPEAALHPGLLAVVALENGAEPDSYVLGSENFYVITRYNWSSYYAMAVIELSQEIQAAQLR